METFKFEDLSEEFIIDYLHKAFVPDGMRFIAEKVGDNEYKVVLKNKVDEIVHTFGVQFSLRDVFVFTLGVDMLDYFDARKNIGFLYEMNNMIKGGKYD